MDRPHDHYQSYSWHQSHDQATVLLLVPYETTEEDVHVIIERNHLVAGVRGQPPIVKGRLYGNVDTATSVWQLEPRASRFSARERTTSTASTISTQSSYAYVSDPDISSSFAASLEGGLVSDADDPLSSPALSSPISSSIEDHPVTFVVPRHRQVRSIPSHSQSTSPPHAPQSFSHISSFSSLESLHTSSERLLTLHLEKAEPIIWPALIVGPVPESMSLLIVGTHPWTPSCGVEARYNMDPTSLVLIGLDLYDIRNTDEDAFEYFVRAWHQAHVPAATMRLATHYLPPQTTLPNLLPADISSPAPAVSPALTSTISESDAADPSTPTASHISESPAPRLSPTPGTTEYYLERLGGAPGLAQLYRAAGLLHLEGTTAPLLSSAYAGLSSLRVPTQGPSDASSSISGTEAWRRDREAARRYFERARALCPALDVPLLPPEDSDSGAESGDVRSVSPGSSAPRRREDASSPGHVDEPGPKDEPVAQPRRRRRKTASGDLSSSIMGSVRTDVDIDDEDRTWYLYIPGLIGAGTALLVVGILSFSSWRKTQSSS
ncbi:hypothetical protein CERSUDRAFT_86877 [Gelatoporia subvermispora B]|uniref:CS domain-containing protein n=1 Tax=Ceriporiopsis subvermispora (strain B) TaxID=914234 RepID=M2R5E2_CERS8|nr:hypothetical protein CERSUDRAFT_86877 [Gelatoporia subvermispora B]